jgi:hypothetical protein
MPRYTILSTAQLLLFSLLTAVFAAVLISINSWYQETRLLPMVQTDKLGACVKVVNFENGHAFNCTDVNVLLRQYRTLKDTE